MTFGGLSFLSAMLGAAAIALLLFALQRLKSRPVTTPFPAAGLWRAVAGEAPRRLLTERFVQLLAYLLALLIALALWFSFAQPERAETSDGVRHVFFLDASAAMTANGRFAAAKRQLLADAASVPKAEREVILGGPVASTLLALDESMPLLRGRLARVEPAVHPSTFQAWFDRIKPSRPVMVHYYGYAAAFDGDKADRSGIDKVAGYLAPAQPDNVGIVALGVSPAASGAVGKADVLVRIAGEMDSGLPDADGLRVDLDGEEIDTDRIRALGAGAFLVPDLDAFGGTLSVALASGDGFAADDTAALTLPDRRRVRVGIAPDIPASIRRVIALDDRVEIVPAAEADVMVRRAGDATGGDKPAFELTGTTGQAAAFTISDPEEDSAQALASNLDSLGLDQIDAGRMADELDSPIAVDIATGPQRSIKVWSAIFGSGSSFSQSRAMPLFVTRSLQWLASPRQWVPYATAGQALPDAGLIPGNVNQSASMNFPLEAGSISLGSGTATVSLASPTITQDVSASASVDSDGSSVARSWAWVIVPGLLLAALLLLGLEWVLLTRRRIA